MQCRDQESTTTDEINVTIDNILEEDRQEKLAKERKRKLYDRQRCEETQERDSNKKQNCPKPCVNTRHIGVKHSKRFCIRVMEAIRAIGRQNESNCATACEIVDYVKDNFESSGDVEAQVRTSLKRTCCEGFVKNEGKDTYSLVGPLACQLTKTQKANANKSMLNESRCDRKQELSPRRRSSSGCKRNNPADTKKSSDTELSIPTSVEEDINREQARRHTPNLQLNDASANARFDLSSEQRIRSPRTRDNLNFNRSAVANQQHALVKSGHSTPRQQSPAREENELLDAARNLDIDFADDDNESYEAPEEQQQAENVDNDDNNDDDDDDVASDDSALHEIRGRNHEARPQLDSDRDRELKRWIRNCRKECAKRNFRREFKIPD